MYAKNAKKGKAVAPPKKPGLPLGKLAMGANKPTCVALPQSDARATTAAGFLIFVLVGSSVFQFVQFITTQKAPKRPVEA